MPWYQNLLVILAASMILPPLGFMLLWLRSTSVKQKLLWTLPVLALTVLHLHYFWGLHYEMAGGGMPRPTFANREAHERELEAHRAASSGTVPTSTQPVVQPAEPEPKHPSVVEASAPPPAAAPASTNYWTDFRGPGRNGIYTEKPILTSWPSSGLKRLWKQPVGAGYASFVIADGLAFTIEQRRDNEVVAAYDVATGHERWTNTWRAHFSESMGGDGPRTTPVYDEGRLYTLGAEGEFRCLEARTGKQIWRKNILEENGATNLMWAQSASPLIVGTKIITLPGGPNGKSVVAYDKLTGKPIWNSQNDEQSYTSPMLVTLSGRQQLLVVSALRMMGLDIDSGKLLWSLPWVTEYHINSAQPIVTGPDRFFISAGYGHGAALVQITGSGDSLQAKTLWQNAKMKNKFNSSVLYQGYIYGLDEAILACINAATGELAWKGGRYGYGQLVLASGHLIVLSEQGDLALVKADPSKHQEVARFSAIEGKTWNHPAIANGVLFVRNATEMAAFQVAP